MASSARTLTGSSTKGASKNPGLRACKRHKIELTAEQILVHDEWGKMCRESGIRGQPDYQFKRKIFNRRKKQAGINAYRKWMTGLCQEAEEAYIAGNAKKLAEITKTIARKGKGRQSNVQPKRDAMVYSSDGVCTFDEKSTTPLNNAQERANYFAKYGAHKFRALGGNMSDLPPLPGNPSDRDYDVLSDEELELCLAAMSSGKAAGHDGTPTEVYKHIPTCKTELFALVRAIWREESVPADMVQGTFVMLFKRTKATAMIARNIE